MKKEIFLSNGWWKFRVVRPIHERIVKAYHPDPFTQPELTKALFNWRYNH